LLSYAAPVTTVFPSALQMWSDNISVIGFQSLLSPEFASVVGAAVTPATSAAIVIAGGSWSPDPTVVAGDWPSLFVGLPLSLQQRIVTFFSTRLWNGQMIVPHGYIASTRSSSNELSVTDSSTVTITDTSVFTMSATNSYSQSISQPQSKSGTLSPSMPTATLSHTKPSSTLTTTPPLRLCPTIEAITIPFDMMDVDIASPLARNVLLVRFAASSNNFENGSFTWSLDLWKYVDFELVVTSPFRGETRGFDAVLSAPLRNASRANGWIPQDDTFQVMALELPTAVNYQLIGDEVIRILFSRDAVAGGCSPNGAQSVAPVPSFLTVMSADFTIHADMSMSLQAASAVVTVVGGTAGVFLAVFGDATTFVSVFDVQLLALLGQMKCALPDQIRFAEYAVYILSPFGGISPQWMALGGAILVLSVAIAHYLFVFIACFLRRDLPTLMHGKAFVRFPGISFALSSLLLAGILSGAFQSTDGTDGKAATSVGQALAGILFGIVFMAYLGNLLFREVPLMIDYRAYPEQDDPLLMKLMSSRSVNWWMPSGVWMARIAPYTAHRAFTAVVGAYNKTSLVTALMMHIHVILMSIVSGYHFADDACVIQYSILLVVQLCFTVFYAVRPPLRVRFLNLILAISNISIVAALAANIAYASNPQPHLSNVQSGLQLLVAAVSLVKVTSLCVIFVLEYRLSPPPLGPPAAPEKKRIPIAHEKSVDFSSSDDDDDSSVDTLGIRRTRPINAAALDDSFSSLASSARSIEEGKHRSSSPTSSPTHQQLPQRSLVNQIHQATIAMEGHNTHTEVSIANKNSTSFDSNDDDDDDL
ncbi:transmembrane protein, putative, partial [Bodo saltans]